MFLAMKQQDKLGEDGRQTCPTPTNGQRTNLTFIQQRKSSLAQSLQIKPKKQKNQPETVEETKARQAALLQDDEDDQVKAAKGMGGRRCDSREGAQSSHQAPAPTVPSPRRSLHSHPILICSALKCQINYTSVSTKNKDTWLKSCLRLLCQLDSTFFKVFLKVSFKINFTLADRDPNNIIKKIN